jgi:hypothetical protein
VEVIDLTREFIKSMLTNEGLNNEALDQKQDTQLSGPTGDEGSSKKGGVIGVQG